MECRRKNIFTPIGVHPFEKIDFKVEIVAIFSYKRKAEPKNVLKLAKKYIAAGGKVLEKKISKQNFKTIYFQNFFSRILPPAAM